MSTLLRRSPRLCNKDAKLAGPVEELPRKPIDENVDSRSGASEGVTGTDKKAAKKQMGIQKRAVKASKCVKDSKRPKESAKKKSSKVPKINRDLLPRSLSIPRGPESSARMVGLIARIKKELKRNGVRTSGDSNDGHKNQKIGENGHGGDGLGSRGIDGKRLVTRPTRKMKMGENGNNTMEETEDSAGPSKKWRGVDQESELGVKKGCDGKDKTKSARSLEALTKGSAAGTVMNWKDEEVPVTFSEASTPNMNTPLVSDAEEVPVTDETDKMTRADKTFIRPEETPLANSALLAPDAQDSDFQGLPNARNSSIPLVKTPETVADSGVLDAPSHGTLHPLPLSTEQVINSPDLQVLPDREDATPSEGDSEKEAGPTMIPMTPETPSVAALETPDIIFISGDSSVLTSSASHGLPPPPTTIKYVQHHRIAPPSVAHSGDVYFLINVSCSRLPENSEFYSRYLGDIGYTLLPESIAPLPPVSSYTHGIRKFFARFRIRNSQENHLFSSWLRKPETDECIYEKNARTHGKEKNKYTFLVKYSNDVDVAVSIFTWKLYLEIEPAPNCRVLFSWDGTTKWTNGMDGRVLGLRNYLFQPHYEKLVKDVYSGMSSDGKKKIRDASARLGIQRTFWSTPEPTAPTSTPSEEPTSTSVTRDVSAHEAPDVRDTETVDPPSTAPEAPASATRVEPASVAPEGPDLTLVKAKESVPAMISEAPMTKVPLITL